MKTKVLILGAGGAIAQHAIGFLKDNQDIELTLFARSASQLTNDTGASLIFEGDVLNKE